MDDFCAPNPNGDRSTDNFGISDTGRHYQSTMSKELVKSVNSYELLLMSIRTDKRTLLQQNASPQRLGLC
jgi:hypothetical protein